MARRSSPRLSRDGSLSLSAVCLALALGLAGAAPAQAAPPAQDGPVQTDAAESPARPPSSRPEPRIGARDLIAPVDPRFAPTVSLVHIKTGTRYQLQLFDGQGELRTEALGDLRDLLKCTRTGIDHPIHWRIVTILVAVSAHYPGRTIQIISGYRHPKVSRHAKRSNHTRGRAIDFRVQGVPNRELRDLVRASFSGIGVGYYPNSTFIHVDVRDREGQWIDYAGPGQDACYSRDVRGDFMSGAAERLTYDQAIARGCKGHHRPAPKTPAPGRPASTTDVDDDAEHDGTRGPETDD